MNMRTKVHVAVAAVRAEVEAGRLQWTEGAVQRLIKPYPRRGKTDAILESIGNDDGNIIPDESSDEADCDNGSDKSETDGSDLERAEVRINPPTETRYRAPQ